MILLNKKETEYAMQHHDLVLAFLNDNKLETAYYNVVIFGFLEAVYQYFRSNKRRGKFAKMANLYMLHHLKQYWDSEEFRQGIPLPPVADLHDIELKKLIQTRHEPIVYMIRDRKSTEKMLGGIRKKEQMILTLTLQGHKEKEICNMLGIPAVSLGFLISRYKNRLTAFLTAN